MRNILKYIPGISVSVFLVYLAISICVDFKRENDQEKAISAKEITAILDSPAREWPLLLSGKTLKYYQKGLGLELYSKSGEADLYIDREKRIWQIDTYAGRITNIILIYYLNQNSSSRQLAVFLM